MVNKAFPKGRSQAPSFAQTLTPQRFQRYPQMRDDANARPTEASKNGLFEEQRPRLARNKTTRALPSPPPSYGNATARFQGVALSWSIYGRVDAWILRHQRSLSAQEALLSTTAATTRMRSSKSQISLPQCLPNVNHTRVARVVGERWDGADRGCRVLR